MYYIERIKNHLINWLEYIIEHLVRVVFLPILLISLFSIMYLFQRHNYIENNILIDQKLTFLDITLDNWFTWISIIGLVLTAIWAIYQFDKSVSRKQQEKGAEISKMVSQVLLDKCAILGNVIVKSELNDIFDFDNLKPSAFKNFDKNELMQGFKDPDTAVLKIKEILNSKEIQQIYFRYLELNITQKKYDILSEKVYNDEEAQNLFILDNRNFPFHFLGLVTSTLNDLEYISMYIASQNTHSKYVYQSLHQFFIRTVKILGPIICLQNKDYSDKYYVNIMHVYNYWCYLRDIDKKKEIKNNNKIKKILNPKIKKV